MDETSNPDLPEDRDTPKLYKLVNEDPHDWLDEARAERSNDLLSILRAAPRQPNVEIRITVTNEETGEVVENVHVESAAIWAHYRTSFKTKVIRDATEQVATRIAVIDENKYDRRFR